ncbi:MAG: tetratricopeptide repeat protein [Gemmatimonadota bacterium]
MSIWRRLLGLASGDAPRPQRLDYLNEALALERQGDFESALTSYRLALRDRPTDTKILQNMAIAYSKTGQNEEAIRYYRRALEIDPGLVGAHYGLGFLLMKRGDRARAAEHLRTFLRQPPKGADADRWVRHAESALRELEAAGESEDAATESS